MIPQDLYEKYWWIIILIPAILLILSLVRILTKKTVHLYYINESDVKKIKSIRKKKGKHLIIIEEGTTVTEYIKWLRLVPINDISAIRLYDLFPAANITITSEVLGYPCLLFLVKGEKLYPRQELEKTLKKHYKIVVEKLQ